jgi:hypothetical protein
MNIFEYLFGRVGKAGSGRGFNSRSFAVLFWLSAFRIAPSLFISSGKHAFSFFFVLKKEI